MKTRLAMWLLLAAAAVGCDDDEVIPHPVSCPNAIPSDGAPCPEAGLVCNYFTGCGPYFPATCEDSGRWSFSDGCLGAHGGGGQSGASTTTATTAATSTTSSASASIGGGGSGGLDGGGLGGGGAGGGGR